MRNADTMHHFKGEKHKWTPNRQRWNKQKKKTSMKWRPSMSVSFSPTRNQFKTAWPLTHSSSWLYEICHGKHYTGTLLLHIPSPFPPLSQPSLSNDRSITATICGDVIFFESEREGFCHVHLLWFVEHSSALTFAWLSDRQEKLISFRWIGKKEAVVKQIYFLNKSILFNLQYVMIICLNLLFTHFNKRQPFFPYKWAQRFEAHFGL